MTHEEISQHLHISRPTVHQRVARLERSNIIYGYHGMVDWNQLDERIKALVFIKIRCNDLRKATEDIVSIKVPGVTVLECQRLAGEWCMMLKVRVAEPRQLTDLIDAIVKIQSVQETSTTFILDTIMEDGFLQEAWVIQEGSECIG